MRVLMFGWEFPPHISGGLGTACFGLTQALARQQVDILFVVPRLKTPPKPGLVKLVSASGTRVPDRVLKTFEETIRGIWEGRLTIRPLESSLFPYATPQTYAEQTFHLAASRDLAARNHAEPASTLEVEGDYGPHLMAEVFRYSQAGAALASSETFDVIHAHDWMAFPAGLMAREISGKPLVLHVHSLEFDRCGKNGNPEVERIEKTALEAADRVIAVSDYTRGLIVSEYGIKPEKIDVVHNAVSRAEAATLYRTGGRRAPGEKMVLFMGRVTFQKGPDYFIEAAALILKKLPNVRFVMAGSGDMLPRMVQRAAQLRIGSRIHFTGFLKGPLVEQMFARSDLYVMPSVSEPFGIAPLEAMLYDVPVLLSRQSGVTEVLRNALKVDFWDVQEMASQIVAVLQHPRLAAEVVKNCREELKAIRWEKAAEAVINVYRAAAQGGH
jgi:glycosyltransferase involved in cell wall biosynthesis